MISGIFHEGSGLGDQLFRYITVRSLAEKKGLEWSMVYPQNFKGQEFISLPQVERKILVKSTWNEKSTTENGVDIRSYDPEINFVEDDTIIDGSFEDDKYWRHNLDNIDQWLKVAPVQLDDKLCVIGFRGGEYSAIRDLFLPKTYWDSAIAQTRLLEPNMSFQVHTDDPTLARQFFPDFEIIENNPISHSKHTNMGLNWRSIRHAKYAIIANSAFYILPRILKHHRDPTAVTIAPRYWARHSSKIWARPACYYPEFTYII